MRIKILNSKGFRQQVLQAGTVVEARKVATRTDRGYPVTGYQITENGPAIGMIIQDIDCEVLPSTPTYTEEEYRAIVFDRDETNMLYFSALGDIAEHGRTIKKLQDQLENLREPLPEFVIKEIERKRAEGQSDYCILENMVGKRVKDKQLVNWLLSGTRSTQLMRALVNGYKVEVSRSRLDQLESDIADFLQVTFGKHLKDGADFYTPAQSIIERVNEHQPK
ncbi:hypothetical protein PA598K_01450 [Paenibacillus sp. 598K]|uniref:hypothetical protein n=1 Tax=Paenibacillus sp. 598K TaxID=1117987 RepID=UPI000FFA6182|nr:hypothetical protein [Paenibacillus sp. 598K]GBF73165.1 hypothetical protein PA598K_01450 [Paenibacillus sp. 598K]